MSDAAQGKPAAPKFWKSRIFLGALAFTVVGAAMWMYALATAPEPAPAPAASSSLPAGVSGFVARSSEPAPPPPPPSRLIDDGAPATFRLGASFLAGYFIAWALRTFVKTTLLVGGAAALGVLALQKTGAINLDWAGVQQQIDQSLAWTRGQAEHFRQLATGYIPSAGAAAVGGFFGIRRA